MGEFSSKNCKSIIMNILKTSSGERIDIAYAIYNQIMLADSDRIECFIYFLENSENVESSDEKHIERVFSEEEKYQYANDYGKIIDGTLEALLKKNYVKEKFYSELWKFIEENPLLDTEKIKAFTLFYIWIDARIPYYELDEGIKMSNDEYANIRQNMIEDIKKARFIIYSPSKQKTETASRLVKMLDDIKDDKGKAVFMAQIMTLSDRSDMIMARLASIQKMSPEEGGVYQG